MDEPRMGLGTDQLELPQQMATGMPALPLALPQQRGAEDRVTLPTQTALAGLAPWAQQLQLPGIDT